MWSTVSNFFRAVAEVFKFRTHRSQLKNDPQVRKAKEQQGEVDRVSEVETAVEKRDLEKIRKELAE